MKDSVRLIISSLFSLPSGFFLVVVVGSSFSGSSHSDGGSGGGIALKLSDSRRCSSVQTPCLFAHSVNFSILALLAPDRYFLAGHHGYG